MDRSQQHENPRISTESPGPGPASNKARGRPRRLWVNLVLFAATCLTTLWVGVVSSNPELDLFGFRQLLPHVGDGVPYAASIMGILLAHEMGHFVLARWHGVPASLPYFIPIPLPPVGTLGAVIRMEGRIGNRNALADIGAAGPLAGLVVAVPVLAYGLHLSPVKPIGPGILEGNSVLYLLLKLIIKGAILPGGGQDVVLSPVAWAGWVGLLVTMINLMPIGQLDGGHIATAYFGDRYNRVSAFLHRALPAMALLSGGYATWELSGKGPAWAALLLGLQAGFPWILWSLVLLIIRRLSGGIYHPPVGGEPISAGRRLLCRAMLAVFALILIPIPIRRTL
jgi:membrane-associated protease RseP (regulator of RpoE activity)